MICAEESPGVCKTEIEDKRVLCTEENKPVCQNGFEPKAVTEGCTCRWLCQCKATFACFLDKAELFFC